MLPVVIIFVAALIYLWVQPLTELKTEAGIGLGQVYFLTIWLAVGSSLAFVFLWQKKIQVYFISVLGMAVSAVLIFILAIVPSVNPYRSTKMLAQKYDVLVPENEKLVFYRRIKVSALFYSPRKALVLKTADQLFEQFMG